MVQIKIKTIKGSYHVYAAYDNSVCFFDELYERLKQCRKKTTKFEVFFHVEGMSQRDVVQLFALCEQLSIKILGFHEIETTKLLHHEGDLRYGQEYCFTQSLLLFGNIHKGVVIESKANLYVFGHVEGSIDFWYEDCILYASSIHANVRIHDSSFQNLTIFAPCKVYYENRKIKVEILKGESSWERQSQLHQAREALGKAVSP